MTKTNSKILDQLRTASDGLLMMSECDYPLEAFLWETTAPATPEKVIQLRVNEKKRGEEKNS